MRQKRNVVIQLTILVALGTAVILTLVLPQLTITRTSTPPVELSVILRDSDSTLWSNARLGMEQAAGELRAELRFLTLSSANDSAEQADLIAREAEGGADVMVVVPADSGQPLATEQLPVVTMESWAEGAAVTVSPDNEALGQELAQCALEDWAGSPVLLIQTAPASAGVSQRLAAARQTLEEAGVLVEAAECPVEELVSVLPDLLKQTGAGQVMVFEPAATQRAAEYKENVGLSQMLYGVGVTSRIAAYLERETVTAVAAWSDFAAGYLAVEGAVHAAQRKPYQADPLPFTVLRGEDIYEPDNQKLLFPVTN